VDLVNGGKPTQESNQPQIIAPVPTLYLRNLNDKIKLEGKLIKLCINPISYRDEEVLILFVSVYGEIIDVNV